MGNIRFLPLLMLLWSGTEIAWSMTAKKTMMIRVGVAANFRATFQHLAEQFRESSGSRIEITSGSTGSLLRQIQNGAPLDMFLAADQKHISALVQSGHGTEDDRFVYARGRLVFWSQNLPDIQQEKVFLGEELTLAIANPITSPYGSAAKKMLDALKKKNRDVHQRLLMGSSVSQVLQFAFADSRITGVVSLAQALLPIAEKKGNYFLIPRHWYPPIIQEGLILKRCVDRQICRRLVTFLRDERGKKIIRSQGYMIP